MPTLTFPLRVAAIDIGSNALRFLAVEFVDDRSFTVLEAQRTQVRLGVTAFRDGTLSEASIDQAVAAIASYRARMDRLDVVHYRAVATSAVRESGNGAELLERVRASSDVVLEAITALEEARLVHVAVRSRVDFGSRQWVLADLGGGSVEVALADAIGVHWSVSHGMGAVRLLAELDGSGGLERCRAHIAAYVASLTLPPGARPAGFIATGGNADALAVVAGAARDERGVSRVPLVLLDELARRMAAMSLRERTEKLGVRAERADVILPAAMVYAGLCAHFGFDTMVAPNVGLREGVVLDLVERMRGA